MNAFIALLPILFLAILFIFMARWLTRFNKRAQAKREQEARELRAVFEELVVPEIRAIREAIDRTAAALRETTRESIERSQEIKSGIS